MRPSAVAAPRGPMGAAPPRLAPLRKAASHFRGLAAWLVAPHDAQASGWLQRRDARAKVLAFVLLAVTATLLSSLAAIVWCYGVALAVALNAGVPPRRLAAMGGWPILLAAIVALPAVFNVVTPGRPLWIVCALPAGAYGPWTLPSTLAVTEQGVFVAARLIARIAATALAVLVLVATSRPDRLWRGLRALGVPRLVVMLLSMMHRYLDVAARAAAELHLARISRTIARAGFRREQHWVAAGIGSLYRRTSALAAAVHLAMWSRGYTGEVRLLHRSAWGLGDTALVAGMVLVCFVLLELP